MAKRGSSLSSGLRKRGSQLNEALSAASPHFIMPQKPAIVIGDVEGKSTPAAAEILHVACILWQRSDGRFNRSAAEDGDNTGHADGY